MAIQLSIPPSTDQPLPSSLSCPVIRPSTHLPINQCSHIITSTNHNEQTKKYGHMGVMSKMWQEVHILGV